MFTIGWDIWDCLKELFDRMPVPQTRIIFSYTPSTDWLSFPPVQTDAVLSGSKPEGVRVLGYDCPFFTLVSVLP
jgi:hypothetical protein